MRDNDLERLLTALGKYPPEERPAWIRELKRLAEIVQSYLALKPKRRRVKPGGKFEFTPEVMILCREAGCTAASLLHRILSIVGLAHIKRKG